MAKYLDPKSDLTFKKVFGEHKDLLISLLNAMLPLQPGKEIVDLEYLSPELVPITIDKKDTIVDVRCQDTIGRQFLVEMQMYWTEAFMQRALLNTCKAYTMPVEKGKRYEELKPIYTISLINDIAFPNLPDEFYHEYVPTDKKHNDYTIQDFEMIFVELPKFKPSNVTDKKMMVLWLRFLTEIDERTHKAPAELTDNTLVSKALELLEDSGYSDAERYAIDRYWDQVSRERSLAYRLEKAIEIENRVAENIKRAVEESRTKEKKDMARNLKSLGVDASTIIAATGLTQSEIEDL